MKCLFWLISTFLIVNTFANVSLAQNRSGTGTKVSRTSIFLARPGIYISICRCHGCSYVNWQRDTILALGKSGIKSYVEVDNPIVSSTYAIKSLKLRSRLRKNEFWGTCVWAGSFNTENDARRVLSNSPSILAPVDDKGEEYQEPNFKYPRELECQGNSCQTGGFFLTLCRVL